MWDIMAVNGVIHALASPLLTPPQSVSMGKGETRPQKVKKGTSLASSLTLPFSLQRAVLGSEPQPVALSLGVVVTSGTLLGLVAGALYLRARGKPRGFSFSVFQVEWLREEGRWVAGPSVLFGGRAYQSTLLFQAEDNADDDFSPWQEGTSPTLVSVPNPVFGSSDIFCEPFDVSVGWEVCWRGCVALGLALLSCTLPPSLQDSVLEEDFPDTQRVLKIK